MDLSNIIINTRMRNGWSAIELGIRFARLFWLKSILLYLTFVLPIYLILSFFNIPGYISLLMLWWLKPVFERPLLFLYSRALFSQPLSTVTVLKQYKQWLYPQIIWTLTIGRISSARCLMSPVALLEAQPFSQFRQRLSIIYQNRYGYAMWLTIVFIHIETFFVYTVYFVLIGFIGDYLFGIQHYSFITILSDSNYLIDFLTILTMACIAPFYCAAGFMLYISRRIELEGWDIEINFKRLLMQLDSTPTDNNSTKKESIKMGL